MYKTMLVLLDGSELAEVVLQYAQELSGRLRIDLELLHVCDPHEAEQLPMRKAYMEHVAETVCARAEEIRSRHAGESLTECIRAQANVVVGNPAEEILRYVDENDVDMVMMSTHGRSGGSRWDLGSVAYKVVHASHVPIWLVPSELREEVILDTLPRRTLVVPLSGTKQSEAVIPHAVAIAQQRGAESELIFLHIDDPGYMVVSRSALHDREEHRAKMKAYLDGLAESMKKDGVDARGEVLVGDPAATILEFLRDNPTQLVAMATRGHTGLSRMVLGSVTENVIHLVKKTPMLLVG
jgi:nucleotide-binding universal stress UspA family protein